MRTRSGRSWIAAGAVLLAVTTGCAAGGRPDDPSASPLPTERVSIPADGIALASYGLSHGPVDQLSVPRGSVVSVEVNQTNNVAVVITSPDVAEVFGYLRRTLPRAGFEVTAADAATRTLTFSGYDWSGQFTGDTAASALLLRPS